MQKEKQISKFLSFVLRHNPQSIGLALDRQGWANIDELIAKSQKLSLSREILEKIVSQNDKQRFAIKDNKIRANQGHSIEVDLALEAVQPPDILYHGTATRFLDSIMQMGLSKQKRQHVHLSKDLDTAKMVGKRHGKLVILEVDTKQMYAEGFDFFLSDNGVWLTDAVPLRFLKEH